MLMLRSNKTIIIHSVQEEMCIIAQHNCLITVITSMETNLLLSKVPIKGLIFFFDDDWSSTCICGWLVPFIVNVHGMW